MDAETSWTPLRAWSSAQRTRCAAAVEKAVRAWQADWLPGDTPGDRASAVAANEDGHDATWRTLVLSPEGSAWVRTDANACGEILQAMFGSPVAGKEGIALAVARRALNALDLALAGITGMLAAPDASGTPDALFESWSGALVVRWHGVPSFALLLDARAVQRLAGPNETARSSSLPPVEPIASALTHKRLKLAVELSVCELSLGALAGLRVGDIVELPHDLDQPFNVTTADATVCAAWLGKQQGHRAIELARLLDFPLSDPQ